MNNPMSLMADAAKLSIPQLQQAIKNGTVPSYIGVPLLQQKVKESQQAKQAMAAQQPAQPPVAQGVMQQAQGVDALPSNLPAAGMAGGGIISFAGNTDGSLVPEPESVYKRIYGQEPDQFGNIVVEGKIVNIRDMPIGNLATVGQRATPQSRNAGLTSVPTSPFGKMPSGSVNENAYRIMQLRDPTSWSIPSVAQTRAHTDLPKWQEPVQAKADVKPAPENQATAKTDSKTPRGGPPQSNAGIDAFRIKPAEYDDSYLNKIVEGDNNPTTGKPWTDAEITAKRRTEEGTAGIKDIYSGQETELQALKDKYAKGSKLDEAMPFFAAAEALTRPTKAGEAPPSFIGSLASGLGAYGKTRGELTDKQEAHQEKIRTESNQLAQAKNAFAQAQINGDRAEIKSAQDTLDSHYKSFSDFGIKKSEANALAEAESKKLSLQNTINERSVGAQYYAANRAQNVINDMAAIYSKTTNPATGKLYTATEAIEKAFLTSNPGFGATAQRDVASQRADLGKRYNVIAANLVMNKDEKARQLKDLQSKMDALDSQGGGASAVAIPTAFYSSGNAGDDAIMKKYGK